METIYENGGMQDQLKMKNIQLVELKKNDHLYVKYCRKLDPYLIFYI